MSFGISAINPRFGHGKTGPHPNKRKDAFKREYRRIKQHNANDPRVKNISEEQFIANKEAKNGKKDWRA